MANIQIQNNDGSWEELFAIKGSTGATPNIQVVAETLPPGSDATVKKSGTAENPTFTIGIPRGESGEDASGGSGVHVGDDAPEDDSINVWVDTDEQDGNAITAVDGIYPDEYGHISLSTIYATKDDVSASSAVHIGDDAPTNEDVGLWVDPDEPIGLAVSSVDGIAPDSTGNVKLELNKKFDKAGGTIEGATTFNDTVAFKEKATFDGHITLNHVYDEHYASSSAIIRSGSNFLDLGQGDTSGEAVRYFELGSSFASLRAWTNGNTDKDYLQWDGKYIVLSVNGKAADDSGNVTVAVSLPSIYMSDVTYDETFDTSTKEWSYTTTQPGWVTVNLYVSGEHSDTNTCNWSAWIKVNGSEVINKSGKQQILNASVGAVSFFAPAGTVITYYGKIQYGWDHKVRGYCNIKVLK